MRDERTIVVLEGDETGQELLDESLRVLQPGVIGIELEFPRFDLSLERRRDTGNAVVHEAAAAIRHMISDAVNAIRRPCMNGSEISSGKNFLPVIVAHCWSVTPAACWLSSRVSIGL